MRLHLKLMALLAAFGLLPTLIVGLYGRASLDTLGSDLAARGRAATTERLTADMAETISQAAALLDHRRVALEMTLRAQGAEVARRLDRRTKTTGPLPPTLVPAGQVPPGAEASTGHAVVSAHPPQPLAVAPDRMTYRLGVETPARDSYALAQARRLADLPPTLGRLNGAVDAGILWQFVITAEGLHLSWPAHAPPPTPPEALEEPRLLPWFSHALETGEPVWTAPHIDPVTGQLVLTAGMPVLDDAGTVTAVTGLHVSVLAGVHALQDRAVPPAGTTGMLVMPRAPTDPTAWESGLRLLAIGRFPAERGDGWAPPGPDTPAEALLPESAPTYRTMVETLAAGGSGTARLPWEAGPALWAYGALPGTGVAVIYVVPFARLNAIAAGVAAMVEDATAGQLAATGGVVLAIIGLAFAGAWIGARQVVEPLRSLSGAMERVAAGDLSARAAVTSRDEVGEAAVRFNAMVPLLEERLGMRQALDLAQDVQQDLLPAEAPVLAGYDLAGASVYSDETGGDYYDYIPVATPDRWAVMVGDVSGHGVSAALLMTTVRAMLRARAASSPDPAALLQSVNPLVAADVSAGRFMTLFCLYLEAGRPEVQWSSAGHGCCLLFDPRSGGLQALEGEDIPLGIDDRWTFGPSHRLALRPGQILLLGTDGLIEARDAAGNEFGTRGLKAALTAHLGSVGEERITALGLRDAILDACAGHRGDRPPSDDTTLVVVRVV